LYWLTFSLIEIQCWESRILERLEKLTGSARQHLIDLIMSIPANVSDKMVAKSDLWSRPADIYIKHFRCSCE
jgi:hypothetical protein